jgi:hypothetical protein
MIISHLALCFKASAPVAFGKEKDLKSTVINDINSVTPSMGYIVNDTLVIQCHMTNVSIAANARSGPKRETRIVDADTAAAAAIAAALPTVPAAITAANPGAVPGAAPRISAPAGMYPAGNGGSLRLPRHTR